MHKVISATTNPAKIQAILKAFEEIFGEGSCHIEAIGVESGVPEQPFGSEEMRAGARNRVANAKAAAPKADFWVAIEAGIDEGATLVTGGLGRPAGLNHGWFAKPTIFGDVQNEMTISKEEIFGPVLSILPYDTVDDAVRMANDTVYGLAAYIAGPVEEAKPVARRLRAGTVNLNYPDWDTSAPFGGYKQSGNGREYADWGIHDFCEIKGIVGYGA